MKTIVTIERMAKNDGHILKLSTKLETPLTIERRTFINIPAFRRMDGYLAVHPIIHFIWVGGIYL
jgi:hypothetical protein